MSSRNLMQEDLILVHDIYVIIIEKLMDILGFSKTTAAWDWDWDAKGWRRLLSIRRVSRELEIVVTPLAFHLLTLSSQVKSQVADFGTISPVLSALVRSHVRVLDVTSLDIHHTPGLTEVVLNCEYLNNLKFSWPAKKEFLQTIFLILGGFVQNNSDATEIEISSTETGCQIIAFARALKSTSGRRAKDRLSYARTEINNSDYHATGVRRNKVMKHLFFDAKSISPNEIWSEDDPAGFAMLQNLAPFTSLSISDSTFAATQVYADNSLQDFFNLSKLKLLKLSENSISEFCRLADLGNLPMLKHIRLSKQHSTDFGTETEIEARCFYNLLEQVNSQCGMKSLEIVGHSKNLFCVESIPNLATISQGLTHLKLHNSLDFNSDNPLITTWFDFYTIGQCCPNLKSFGCDLELRKTEDVFSYVELINRDKFTSLHYLHLGFTQGIGNHMELDSRAISMFDNDVEYDNARILMEQVFFLKSTTSCPLSEMSLNLRYGGKWREPVPWEACIPNLVALSAKSWTGLRAWKEHAIL